MVTISSRPSGSQTRVSASAGPCWVAHPQRGHRRRPASAPARARANSRSTTLLAHRPVVADVADPQPRPAARRPGRPRAPPCPARRRRPSAAPRGCGRSGSRPRRPPASEPESFTVQTRSGWVGLTARPLDSVIRGSLTVVTLRGAAGGVACAGATSNAPRPRAAAPDEPAHRRGRDSAAVTSGSSSRARAGCTFQSAVMRPVLGQHRVLGRRPASGSRGSWRCAGCAGSRRTRRRRPGSRPSAAPGRAASR